MLKLKRIDLLTKNDKIHKNGCCDHVQKYKKLECLCWEDGRVGMSGWLQFGRGEVGWGRRRRNRGRECRQSGYIFYCYRWNHRQTRSVGIPVGDSTCESVTSLYEDPGLNSSVIPSETNPRHHTVATFQKKLYSLSTIRSVYTDGRIPSVYTDRIADECSLSVYTERFWDGIISVGKNYRQKISSISPLVFADFLVVTGISCKLSWPTKH